MSVAHCAHQPVKAVIAPCVDAGFFALRTCRFFIYRIAKYVVDALYLPAVAVCMQHEAAFLVILEGFCISELVLPKLL